MLSIGKLGKGQERYYLEKVAEGTEDYYPARARRPGNGWATQRAGLVSPARPNPTSSWRC